MHKGGSWCREEGRTRRGDTGETLEGAEVLQTWRSWAGAIGLVQLGWRNWAGAIGLAQLGGTIVPAPLPPVTELICARVQNLHFCT